MKNNDSVPKIIVAYIQKFSLSVSVVGRGGGL